MLENKSHVTDRRAGAVELPRSYGFTDEIRLKNPPVTIQLNKAPVANTLFVGPGILLPLPIIPWIPGMIKALKSPPADVSPDNRVKFLITFDPYQDFRKPVHLEYDPSQAKLIVGEKTLLPSSWESKPAISAKAPLEAGQEGFDGCYSEGKDGIIIAPQPSSKCGRVIITATYDISYSELRTADFEMGEVLVDHQAVTMPRTRLINRGKLKLWWAYTFNT